MHLLVTIVKAHLRQEGEGLNVGPANLDCVRSLLSIIMVALADTERYAVSR